MKHSAIGRLCAFVLMVCAHAAPLALSTTASAQAVDVFVDPTSPGTQTGTSWPTAWHKLQDAFDDALNRWLLSSTPSEIHIAQGVYKPDEDEIAQFFPGVLDHVNNDRNESFFLVPGITLRGGYPPGGAETPSPSLFVTVLSGDIGDLPGDVDSHDPVPFTNMEENSRHVLDGFTEDDMDEVFIDGFTITSGNADGAQLDFDNVGGGAVLGAADAESLFTFRRCVFTRNTSHGGGGAIYGERIAVTLRKSLVIDNRTLGVTGADPQGGGGVAVSLSSDDLLVLDSEFVRNVAVNGNGGGVASTTYTTIVSSAFTDNAALSGSGGGVWTSGATSSVINTVCQGNIADGTGNDGRGGGAFIDGIDSVVVNSTFAENSAREVGGLYANGAVENCILYFNEADQLQTCPFAPITIPYSGQISWEARPTKSCIQNWVWTGQWPCGPSAIPPPPNPQNIASDPQFRNMSLGNLRLQVDSPCIDNGLDSFVPNDEEDVDESMTTAEPTPDRDLNVRIQDGGLAREVDMGAYEYMPQSDCPADINGDDTVDGFDLAILLGAWGTCDSCPADLNEDGLVDGFDLALLLGAWGPCGESLAGGGGSESQSSSSSAGGCGGGIDLFQHWLDTGDMDAFWQWLNCTLGLPPPEAAGGGGATQ